MIKKEVPKRLLTEEQISYQKTLRQAKKQMKLVRAIADHPVLGVMGGQDMLRQAALQLKGIIQRPPKRSLEELAGQPNAEEEE